MLKHIIPSIVKSISALKFIHIKLMVRSYKLILLFQNKTHKKTLTNVKVFCRSYRTEKSRISVLEVIACSYTDSEVRVSVI